MLGVGPVERRHGGSGQRQHSAQLEVNQSQSRAAVNFEVAERLRAAIKVLEIPNARHITATDVREVGRRALAYSGRLSLALLALLAFVGACGTVAYSVAAPHSKSPIPVL